MEQNPQAKGLGTAVRYLKGVGEARATLLDRLGIRTVGDLLLTLPRRYEDRRQFLSMADLKSGETVTVAGEIKASGSVRPRYGKAYFEAVLSDGKGMVHCRWYGAHYLQDQMKIGDRLVVYGKVSKHRGTHVLHHPEFEIDKNDDEDSLHINRIVPVYHLTEHLGQRTLRRIVWNAVGQYADDVEDMLPEGSLERLGLPGIRQAVRQVHFPESMEAAESARYRIVFDEFLCAQLVLVARKVYAERFLDGDEHVASGNMKKAFLESLPFSLTGAQERVIEEIEADLKKPRPMHRLLQGDVGSGKTVVASCALLDTIEAGSQGAVMAPTEILAGQHYETFSKYLAPLGVTIQLLTSGMSASDHETAVAAIREGQTQLVVGTHAVIQEKVAFHDLGLVVIDEQHKFGVEQRGILYKKGRHPDVLVMTATPIPRTLAMTVYGDLDVSILDEMPPGRQEIVTRVIREDQLPDAYGFVKKQVAKGRQAYFIYPLVADSDKSDWRSAEEMYDKLKKKVFTAERLGLLHGQMSSEDKTEVMHRFRDGEIDVLVATTVVEVGIDVPNANVMLVENAERFGLAQLHQLRGRIGRGAYKSFCILQGSPNTLDSWKRLKVMAETTDGFRVAEEDLRMRGMGNLLGREQSGFPTFRAGDPLGDADILQAARKEAFAIVEADPRLEDPRYALLRARARALYKIVGSFVEVG